jgi:2-polyprenyl-3-methyl-5-hydroxy-6-metoxy-1,4-benzoquinol methylase
MEAISSLAGESQEVVVTFDVIEHFRKDEVIAFVDQVRRVLRPCGRWIIHTPNGESPFGARMRYWDFTMKLRLLENRSASSFFRRDLRMWNVTKILPFHTVSRARFGGFCGKVSVPACVCGLQSRPARPDATLSLVRTCSRWQ